MPTIPTVTYARILELALYDGTNDADLLTTIQQTFPSASAIGGTPGVTTIIRTDIPDNGGQDYTFRIGDSWENAQGLQRMPYEGLNLPGFFVPLDQFITDVMTNGLAGLLPVPEFAGGYAAVPSLGIGGSATLTVPIKPTLPSASGYTPVATVAGGLTLLGNLEIFGTPTMVGGSACSVGVRNTGLLSLGTGATVMVHCMKS